MNTTLNPIERPARSPYSGRKMAKPVNFFYENPDAHSVSLLGDFNGWNGMQNTAEWDDLRAYLR
jgi:hypothetical protein